MNKKGFVVSAILYPLLILFLALLMGLLSMNSTRKNILDNMKLEISDSIFDSVTCDCEVINNTLKTYSQHFNTVDEEIEALKTEISNLKTEASNHASTTTTDLLNSKIAALTTRVSNLESSISLFTKAFKKQLKVGDYVYMKPKKTSYTIESLHTGCPTDKSSCNSQSAQKINPSELTLWRVIRVNDDGTYDAVSVYTSSKVVYLYGAKGFSYLVGQLNVIASQYTDNKYVVSTRCIGYNGQPAYTAWNVGTDQDDTLYSMDTELVNNVFGTLVANKIGTATAQAYWLASRHRDNHYEGPISHTNWSGRYVADSGGIKTSILVAMISGSSEEIVSDPIALRPIVTLKPNYVLGYGTEENPYILQ